MTGQHQGHAQVRANEELHGIQTADLMSESLFRRSWENPDYEGQYPLAAGTETIGTMMQTITDSTVWVSSRVGTALQ